LPWKTDSNNPGDWLTIAESELEALPRRFSVPSWNRCRACWRKCGHW